MHSSRGRLRNESTRVLAVMSDCQYGECVALQGDALCLACDVQVYGHGDGRRYEIGRDRWHPTLSQGVNSMGRRVCWFTPQNQ